MSDFGFHLAFWSLALMTLGGASMILISRNLIHAVIWLVMSMLGIAGLYLTLSADFIAVVQVLIYVGAISVLMLFAIMLTPRAERDNSQTKVSAPAGVVVLLVMIATMWVAVDTDWGPVREGALPEQARLIGESLINHYILPFEIGAVLLTAALVGAIALARQDDEDGPVHTASLQAELDGEIEIDPADVVDPPLASDASDGGAPS